MNVIGVISPKENERTLRDMDILSQFKCDRVAQNTYTNNKYTSGVLGTNDYQRTEKDLQLISNFKCNRERNMSYSNGKNGSAVLGTNIYERSNRDKDVLSQFSCDKIIENYTEDDMMYPRSIKDKIMLKNFNCPCKEDFEYKSSHSGQKKNLNSVENYNDECSGQQYAGGCPSGNCPDQGFYGQLNFNPNNSSGKIFYMPLN